MNGVSLFHLLQLASSNLPVGGFTFSQGLEYAIENAWIGNETEVKAWIEQSCINVLVYSDLPLLSRQFDAIHSSNWSASEHWNEYALAIRETHELLLADTAMGEALFRLAMKLDMTMPEYCYARRQKLSYTTAFSLFAHSLQVELTQARTAYAWTLIESQVLAATKLLPMGQTAAQKMILTLSEVAAKKLDAFMDIPDEAIGLSLPGVSMASALHETQYSRLYRS